MDYKCQGLGKNKENAATHYRCWKRGKSWCYGFSVLAAIAGCTVLFQETASADEVANAAQTELTAQTDEQIPLTTAGAETDEQAPAELPETSEEPNGQNPPAQATTATEPEQAQPLQDLPDAAAPDAQIKEIVDEDKVQADTVDSKPENTAQDVQPQIPKQQSLPQVPELHREQVSPDATGVWGDISWVYDSATQTLRFTSSGTIPPRNYFSSEGDDRPWMRETNHGADIRKIVFEKPVTAPINAGGLFSGDSYSDKSDFKVEKIEGLEKIDVSETTDMSYMFDGCNELTDIVGLSSWNVFSVTDMYGMFRNCTSLKDFSPLSRWDVSSMTDMSSMFLGCAALTNLAALSGWNVSNVTWMRQMFYGCAALTDLTALSGWNVSNVTWIDGMFGDCTSLTDLTPLSRWDVSSVTDMSNMFYDCAALTGLSALSSWNVSNVTSMNWMFSDCSSLESADALNNWQVQAGTDVSYMFENCSNLQSIGIAAWNLTGNPPENIEGMFNGCTRLGSITLGSNSYWLTDAVNIGLPEIDTGSGEYTGEWFGLNTGRIYRSSEDFIKNYDGSVPDTYVWRKKFITTVHYDVNGGNSSSAPADETRPFLQGEAGGVTASAAVPARDETARAGYEFIGWNTMPDGSGTFYRAGELVKSANGATTTLYAQWREKLKSSTVTVHYVDENGNEIASPVEITGTIDDAYATQCLSDDQCRKDDIFYILTKTPSNATGIYTAGGITVTYVYKAVKHPIYLPPEPPGPTVPTPPTPPAPPAPPTDKENPYALINMSLSASATQTESSVTKPRVLPNTGSNSGTSALLAGAFSLLGAGVSTVVRLKRRRN